LSNIALISLAAKLNQEKSCKQIPRLIVDDVTPINFYNEYPQEHIKELYREIATRYGLEVRFNSDNPNFISNLNTWLQSKTLADLLSTIPQGKINRYRGTILAYDVIHLAAMAASWSDSEEFGLVLHAKNVVSLRSITTRALPLYVSCHNFEDYGIRFQSAIEFRSLFSENIDKYLYNQNHIFFQANMCKVGILPTNFVKVGVKLINQEINKVSLITSWTFNAEGGGVSMSICNTIAALNSIGVEVVTPINTKLSSWANFLQRREYNEVLGHALQRKASGNPIICVDWDGFTIPGRRAGGQDLKIVHVRTNFDDITRFENGEMAPYCQMMAECQRQNLLTADGIIVSSMYTYQKLRAIIPDNVPICIIRNGINTNLVSEINGLEGVGIEPRSIFALGSFHQRKSFDTLIRASLTLMNQDVHHKLILAGDGPEHESYLRLIGNAQHIEVIPFISNIRELATHYCRAAIICHPSLQEDFGNIYIEAGVAGKPIIGARTMFARELIVDGKTGLLFQPGNHLSLAMRLMYLLENESVRSKFGENARQEVPYYTWNRYALEVIEFIKTL
jgi:glycosyltransferase involved in cell wall biosynthesis